MRNTNYGIDLTTMEEAQKRVIGRFVAIRVGDDIMYGNVLDCMSNSDLPKRVRIQRGNPAMHGRVLMPHDYVFMWFADEEED